MPSAIAVFPTPASPTRMAAREDLQHAPNLLVAADHRVELAAARLLIQVYGIFAQRVELLRSRLRIDRRSLAEDPNRLHELLLRGSGPLQQIGRLPPLGHEGQQQVLDRGILVAELLREVDGPLDHLRAVVREIGLAAGTRHARQRGDGPGDLLLYAAHVHADAAQQESSQRILLAQQDPEQMQRLHSLLAVLLRRGYRTLQRLLRLDG